MFSILISDKNYLLFGIPVKKKRYKLLISHLL